MVKHTEAFMDFVNGQPLKNIAVKHRKDIKVVKDWCQKEKWNSEKKKYLNETEQEIFERRANEQKIIMWTLCSGLLSTANIYAQLSRNLHEKILEDKEKGVCIFDTLDKYSEEINRNLS